MKYTYTIKSSKEPKVVEKILSLCRRKLYLIEEICAKPTDDNKFFNTELIITEENEEKAKKLTNHIKKIIEVLEVKLK